MTGLEERYPAVAGTDRKKKIYIADGQRHRIFPLFYMQSHESEETCFKNNVWCMWCVGEKPFLYPVAQECIRQPAFLSYSFSGRADSTFLLYLSKSCDKSVSLLYSFFVSHSFNFSHFAACLFICRLLQ